MTGTNYGLLAGRRRSGATLDCMPPVGFKLREGFGLTAAPWPRRSRGAAKAVAQPCRGSFINEIAFQPNRK